MGNDMEMKVKITAETDDKQVKKEWEKAWKEIAEWIWKSTKSNKGAIAEIWKDAWETFWQSFSDKVNTFLMKSLKFEVIKDSIVKIAWAIKDFLVDSVDLANKYESAFAWVRKTVDWTESDFKKLDSSLRKMAKEIPVAYENLAWIMELWWQLGVDIKNMEKFTKVIAQLWVATNMTAEESAQMLAQFANITKMDLNDIDKLGSVIVDLWNNFATTENDITNFASRIAGAGQIAWISQANIMAIATAFSSVWIEAEAWWTAVQKVLLQMNNAVVQGGDKLELYAKTLWVTAEEFKTLFNSHPEKAFEEFVKWLSKAWDEAQLTLSELWLNDERLTRAFLSLAQNSDILTETIEMSNKARDENVALMNESEQRFATTESQLIMLQNERANLMAWIWEKLQWIALTWEKVKTAVVETVAELSGVTVDPTALTDALETWITSLDSKIDELKEKLAEWKISVETYWEQYNKLIKIKEDYQDTLDNEKDELDDLKDDYEDFREEYDKWLKVYENRIETWGSWHLEASKAKEIVEKYRQKMQEAQDQIDQYNAKIEEKTKKRKKWQELFENLLTLKCNWKWSKNLFEIHHLIYQSQGIKWHKQKKKH